MTDHLERFVAEQVSSGRFASANEVVGAALELLEAREVKLAALREAIDAGLRSGEPKAIDREAFMRDLRARHSKSVG